MKLSFVIIGAVVIALLAAGGGFYGGMTYAQAQAQSSANAFLQQRAIQNGQGGNAQGGSSQNLATDPCGFPIRTSQNSNNNQATGQSGQNSTQGGQRQFGQFGGTFGSGFNPAQVGNCVARGEIKSVNGDTVEISTANSVVTVKVNDQTLISKTDRGTLADLQPGDRVTVFSKETGDSPTASTIQLQRPIAQPQQSQP
ncbi:MAG: hypothetical protein HY741_05595 [Chloroflexi bacterium]|nr:hypothetical protein [Chloroflexota bacterium]